MIDILSEQRENQLVHHYCLATDDHRYDLSVIYSNQFIGKAMVVSIQTGKMVLMCQEDIKSDKFWAEKLGIMAIDIGDCKKFLEMILINKHYVDQY
jgi:Protein of unknown function (DUF3055)